MPRIPECVRLHVQCPAPDCVNGKVAFKNPPLYITEHVPCAFCNGAGTVLSTEASIFTQYVKPNKSSAIK